MKITNIIVRAGRTFNHPYESYSNLKPEVELTATLEEGEDAIAATRELQAKAEGLVEDHKQGLLRSIEELHQMAAHQSELRGLEQELQRAQERIEQIRKQTPQLVSLQAPVDAH